MAPRFAAAAPRASRCWRPRSPIAAFVAVARALFPAVLRPSSLFGASGRAPSAQVHASARIEAGVTIDPLAVIGPRAEIGAGTLIARRRGDRSAMSLSAATARSAPAPPSCMRPDRRPRDHPSRRPHRPGRLRLSAVGRRAIRKSRKPAASSFKTTSRSAPTPRSTAARRETPSSARAPRSTISCKSRHNVIDRAALLDCCASRHIRQRGGGRFCHAGRAGRRRRSIIDRRAAPCSARGPG